MMSSRAILYQNAVGVRLVRVYGWACLGGGRALRFLFLSFADFLSSLCNCLGLGDLGWGYFSLFGCCCSFVAWGWASVRLGHRLRAGPLIVLWVHCLVRSTALEHNSYHFLISSVDCILDSGTAYASTLVHQLK